MYTPYDTDSIFIDHDLNARKGTKLEYIEGVDDEIVPRRIIDNANLIEFWSITLKFNNFTAITSERTAIVDYVVTKADNLHNVAGCSLDCEQFSSWNFIIASSLCSNQDF